MTQWKWTLPQALQAYLQARWQTINHFGLLLDKFTPYAEYEYTIKRQGREETTQGYRLGRNDLKREWLNDALAQARQQVISQAVQDYRQRWKAVVRAANGSRAEMVTVSPLIVGLGAGHVLETSMILDRNTGMPIVPGSALKGLARTVGLIEVAQAILDNPHPEDLQQLDEEITSITEETVIYTHITHLRDGISDQELDLLETFIKTFGTPNQVGNIVFVDGIYAGNSFPEYHLDIMNPHFPKYYGGNDTPPSDDQNPIPVPYLTVATGQPFLFALLPRTQAHTDLLDTAGHWLIQGLTEIGIGAKTAQGYGLFVEPQN